MSFEIAAPNGAHWEFEEVSTGHGKASLGEVPLLIWDDFNACVEYFTAEGVIAMLDGTSFRVSQQGIARRLKAAGKSNNEIAEAILKFRPGKRAGTAPTPVSRARKAAAEAATVVQGDAITLLLQRIAAGQVKIDESGNIVE